MPRTKKNNPMTLIGKAVSVDIETGEETVMEDGGMWMMPNKPGTCDWCAVDHPPHYAHNKDSLYYQMKFKAIHGRYPTWADAMAHMEPECRETWKKQLIKLLRERGMPIPDDLK